MASKPSLMVSEPSVSEPQFHHVCYRKWSFLLTSSFTSSFWYLGRGRFPQQLGTEWVKGFRHVTSGIKPTSFHSSETPREHPSRAVCSEAPGADRVPFPTHLVPPMPPHSLFLLTTLLHSPEPGETMAAAQLRGRGSGRGSRPNPPA